MSETTHIPEVNSTSSSGHHSAQSLSTQHSDAEHNKDSSSESYEAKAPREFTRDPINGLNTMDPDPELADDLSRLESGHDTARTLSRRLTSSEKDIEEANKTDVPMPTMGGGRPYPPDVPDRQPYCVAFDGPDDPTHPHNYAISRKLRNAGCVTYAALCVSMGSAIYSSTTDVLSEKFHVGATTITLGTSLYVFGFATGPIVYGPMSELYGRKPMMIIASFAYTIFSFGVGTAQNLQTIMICRFFCGFVGSASFVVAPAVMADTFAAQHRGRAMSVFAMVLFGGPMLAPFLGAFITKNSSLGWRWTAYICGIIGSASTIANVFILDETHYPLILVKKAETLRRRTGNWGIYAPHEEISLSFKDIAQKNLSRPAKMLATEPIIQLIGLYNAFIYGMLYLFLTCIPVIFAGKYHWQTGVSDLPYLSMFLGVLGGCGGIMLFDRRYVRAMKANGGKPVPEERLLPMMVGGTFFTIGLFWIGWTGQYPEKIHWIVPVIGAWFVGFGLIMAFLPCMTYIVDCYLVVAASALASNTFLRSAFGGIFPLFARQLFDNLGVNWGTSLVGFVSLAMIPVPFMFYKYGRRLRQKSKFAFVLT